MKLQKLIFLFTLLSFLTVGCKNQTEKTTIKEEILAANTQKVSLNISGMTCEIGCAKTIQSKLSKKEGVMEAKVIFKDSIANIKFDANKTSKNDLIAFVDGIAGGDLYKATETATKEIVKNHICDENCKKDCELKADKTACKKDCKMACCADKKKA